jgi:hypothetical protein
MRSLFLLLALISSLNLFAQDPTKPYQYEAPTGTVYLLADAVNLRSAPKLDADLVAKLPIASKLEVLENSNENLTLKGITAPWYKVKFTHEGKSKEAYVWSGFIAEKVEHHATAGIHFLLGPASAVVDKNDQTGGRQIVNFQIRAAKDNKELSKVLVEQDVSSITYFNLKTFGNKGFDPIKNIIEFHFNEDMCAGANGQHTIFWDGKALIYVDALYSGSDVPVFAREYFAYPNDEEGKKGFVIKRSIEGAYVEDTEEISRDDSTPYVWYENSLRALKD